MHNILLLTIGFPEIVLILFFAVIPLLLMVFSLLDIFRSSFKSNDVRILWMVLVLVPVLGAVLYLVLGRTKKIQVKD
jgi:hypothetical protein